VTRLLGDLRVRVLEVNLQDVGILDRGHVEMLQELDLVHPARTSAAAFSATFSESTICISFSMFRGCG
jgi:hypothetical protein